MKKKKAKTSRKSSKKVEKKAGVRPFGDRVLVRPFTEEELKGGKKNHFGIIVPDSVSKEKSAQGKVLAVGEGKLVDGKLVKVRLNVGDIVVFSKYGYDEVEHEGEQLYLLKEETILAVIK